MQFLCPLWSESSKKQRKTVGDVGMLWDLWCCVIGLRSLYSIHVYHNRIEIPAITKKSGSQFAIHYANAYRSDNFDLTALWHFGDNTKWRQTLLGNHSANNRSENSEGKSTGYLVSNLLGLNHRWVITHHSGFLPTDRNHLYFHFFFFDFFYQSVTNIFFDFFSFAIFLSKLD